VNDAVARSTPTGGVRARRRRPPPAVHADRRAQGGDPAHRRRAWKPGQAKQGAPGSDGRRLADVPAVAREHGPTVRHARRNGTSQPAPGRRVAMPTPGGRGARWLGLPTGWDRGRAPALAQVLTPRVAPAVSAARVGWRPGRAAQGALRPGPRDRGEGYRSAGAVALEPCVDRGAPDARLTRVARKGREKRLLSRSGRARRAGGVVGDCIQATEVGPAPSAPLSPWLAQGVVDDLDQERARRGHRVAREADDRRGRVPRGRAGARVKARLTRVRTTLLTRRVNASKSRGWRTAAGGPRLHLPGHPTALGRGRRRRRHAPQPATPRARVGRGDGLSAGTARARHQRREEGLRHRGRRPAPPGGGPRAAAAEPPGRRETVAPGAHQSPSSPGLGHGQTPGDADGAERQGLLAPVDDPGHASRQDEGRAAAAGCDIRAGPGAPSAWRGLMSWGAPRS
jgi:hypothetical protein